MISEQICPEAKKYIKDLRKLMKEEGVTTALDDSVLELLGITYHNWYKAQETVLEQGQYIKTNSGDLKVHPCVKIALDEKIQLTKIFESLGMTPKSRKEIAKSKEKGRELTPMDKFLNEINAGKDATN